MAGLSAEEIGRARFQKDLVVWKLGIYNRLDRSGVMFQKDLVVWKHYHA